MPGSQGNPHLEAARIAAERYAGQARASGTEKGYARDWADFSGWCHRCQLEPLPATPETVACYLAACAEYLKPATIQRRLASIVVTHQRSGFAIDIRAMIVREVWQGIRRHHGIQQEGRRPLLTDDVRSMVAELPMDLAGKRDRALILLGFAGALRRSELVGLDVEDLQFSSEGISLRLQHGKTDRFAAGELQAIPRGQTEETCPVAAVKAWLTSARLGEGPLFRPINRHSQVSPHRLTAQSVALVVKRAIVRAGLAAGLSQRDAEERARTYSGHSLRAGFATSAARAGAPEWAIMVQTKHRRRETVRRYIRLGSQFRDNPAAKLGL